MREIVNAGSVQERVEIAKSAANAAVERSRDYARRVTRYAIDVGKKAVEGLGRIGFPEPAATSSFVKIDKTPPPVSYDRQQPSLFGSDPIEVSIDILGTGILRDVFEASKQLVRTGNVPELYSAAKRRISAGIGAAQGNKGSFAAPENAKKPSQAEPLGAAMEPTKPGESLFGSKPITWSALKVLGRRLKDAWPKPDARSQFVDITPDRNQPTGAAYANAGNYRAKADVSSQAPTAQDRPTGKAQAAANQAAYSQEATTERMRVVEYYGRSQLGIFNPVTEATDGRPLRYAGREADGQAVAFDSNGSRVLAMKAKRKTVQRPVRDRVSMFNPVTSAGSVYITGDGAGGVFYRGRNGEMKHQPAGVPAPVTVIAYDEPEISAVPESPRAAERRNAQTEEDIVRARYAVVGAIRELSDKAIATLELSDAQKKLLEISSLNDKRLSSSDSDEWEDLVAKYHNYLETLGRLTPALRKDVKAGDIPGYA